MRVLYIPHDENLWGGANFALLELFDSLKKHDEFIPIVLVPNKKGALIEALNSRGISFVVFPYHWWVYEKSSNIIKNLFRYGKVIWFQIVMRAIVKKLVNMLKGYDIDIIHTNSSVVNLGAWINKYMGIPHVWHVREFGEEHLNYRFLLGRKFSRKLMGRYSSKIVTISNILYKKYERYVPNNKLQMVYDGVSSIYDNRKNKFNDDKFTLLITGTVHRSKGQMEAVKAVCQLLNQGFDMRLMIAGYISDENYLEHIKQTIKLNNATENIIYLGNVNDMNSLRRSVNVELVCSDMEAFGRVTVEAMFSMIPVIGADSGATSELIKNGINGYLYAKGNVDELADKISLLYNDRSLIEELGSAGYVYVKQRFTSLINATNIYDIYQKVLRTERNIKNEVEL